MKNSTWRRVGPLIAGVTLTSCAWVSQSAGASELLGVQEDEQPESAAPEQPSSPPDKADEVLLPSPWRPIEDAFWFTPHVQKIHGAEDLAILLNSECDPPCDDFDAPGLENCQATRLRFDSPAHFPLPEFGPTGQRFDAPGALIYEGMQFVYYPNTGRYRVRFVTGTPAMPVVLRLRLVLYDKADDTQYTLTLPQIKIPGNPESYEREALHLVQVNGYLPVLKLNSKLCLKRREGTALFGFGLTHLQKPLLGYAR